MIHHILGFILPAVILVQYAGAERINSRDAFEYLDQKVRKVNRYGAFRQENASQNFSVSLASIASGWPDRLLCMPYNFLRRLPALSIPK